MSVGFGLAGEKGVVAFFDLVECPGIVISIISGQVSKVTTDCMEIVVRLLTM